MARRRHLIAYDIRDARRLSRVAKVMEAFGYRIQYSVFFCDLSVGELATWRAAVTAEMDTGVDSVLIIDLGAVGDIKMRTIGTRPPEVPDGPTII